MEYGEWAMQVSSSATSVSAENYEALIAREAAFWDAEFVENPEGRFRCFFHKNAWIRQHLTLPLIARIQAHVAPQSAVLELGCGHGWLSLLLAGRAGRVVGSDVAPLSLEAARRKAAELGLKNCEFTHLDANRDPFPDGPFDIVVVWGALHHLVGLPHMAAEVRRVLAPGGRLIVCECIDQPGLRGRIARGLGDALHLLLPTDRSYAEKLRFAWSKLTRRPAREHAWSPFEMAGGAEWRSTLRASFQVEQELPFMAFASPFLARIKERPAQLHRFVTWVVYRLDHILVRLRLLPAEYCFVVYKP